jgi:glycosyltransferase involved in cell wall biosynthesis
MKQRKVSIVVPLFNEKESLGELVDAVTRAFRGYVFECVFVDDGSTDGSFQKLVALRKKMNFQATLVRLRRRSGKSAALSEGFRHITGDVVVTLDADLQDDPFEATKLIKKLDEGFDLVVGWRRKRRDSGGKLGVSHLFNWGVAMASGVRLHDMNSGLKAMKSDVAKEIHLYGELHRFVPVLAYARGFKVGETPIVHHPRKYGTSKFGFERIFAAFDLLTTLFLAGFGTRPLMIFGPPGVLLIATGTFAIGYLSVLHFMGQSIGTRPLLLFGVLFVLFGLQLLSTGLLGELITSISTNQRRSPVSEIITYEYNH